MKLRTVHINTETAWRGGERQTLCLVDGLTRRGHAATLVTKPKTPLETRARTAGIDVFPIQPINEGDPLTVFQLVRLLKRCRPHILHMHAPHAHLLGLLASFFTPRVSCLVSRRVEFSIYRRWTFGLNWFKYGAGIEHYIAVSKAVRNRLVRDGIRESKISVVYSGVSPPQHPSRSAARCRALCEELEIAPGIPVVIAIGSLVPAKGYADLLVAACHVLKKREAAFVIFGEGKQAGLLAELAKRYGIDKFVRFPGFRDEVLSFLPMASVYVQPSVQEGLGTSLMDSLYLKVPVVASAVGGVPEVVEDRHHGLLVPPRDPAALAAAILEILQAPDFGESLATAGRQRILQEFSVERMVEETLAVYMRLLTQRQRALP